MCDAAGLVPTHPRPFLLVGPGHLIAEPAPETLARTSTRDPKWWTSKFVGDKNVHQSLLRFRILKFLNTFEGLPNNIHRSLRGSSPPSLASSPTRNPLPQSRRLRRGDTWRSEALGFVRLFTLGPCSASLGWGGCLKGTELEPCFF